MQVALVIKVNVLFPCGLHLYETTLYSANKQKSHKEDMYLYVQTATMIW